MSIASEITRLQGVKSDILTAIADKGVVVPAGSALDDCPGLIASIPSDIRGYYPESVSEPAPQGKGLYLIDNDGYIGGTCAGLAYRPYYALRIDGANFSSLGLGKVDIYHEESTEIGGKTYRTKRIHNAIWMLENLEYEDASITHGASGAPTTPASWYYNDDEATYGRSGKNYGYLYNWYAAKYMTDNVVSLFGNNWGFARGAFLDRLIVEAGGTADNVAPALKSTSEWTQNLGTNEFGFNLKPYGYRKNDGTYSGVGENGYVWVLDEIDTSQAYRYAIRNSLSSFLKAAEKKVCGFSVRMLNKFLDGNVTIGGKTYKTITLADGKQWLAENLDYQFNGCDINPVGTPTTPAAWYYNNDESTYGWNGYKCGLLYNWYAAKYLDDNRESLLPSGWRVATNSDYIGLHYFHGNANEMKAVDGSAGTNFPSGWNGTNIRRFSVLPAGFYDPSTSTYSDIGVYGNFWTAMSYDNNNAFVARFDNSNSWLVNAPRLKYSSRSIRLVKD